MIIKSTIINELFKASCNKVVDVDTATVGRGGISAPSNSWMTNGEIE